MSDMGFHVRKICNLIDSAWTVTRVPRFCFGNVIVCVWPVAILVYRFWLIVTTIIFPFVALTFQAVLVGLSVIVYDFSVRLPAATTVRSDNSGILHLLAKRRWR